MTKTFIWDRSQVWNRDIDNSFPKKQIYWCIDFTDCTKEQMHMMHMKDGTKLPFKTTSTTVQSMYGIPKDDVYYDVVIHKRGEGEAKKCLCGNC